MYEPLQKDNARTTHSAAAEGGEESERRPTLRPTLSPFWKAIAMIAAASVVVIFLVNSHSVKFNVHCVDEEEFAAYNSSARTPRPKNLSTTIVLPGPTDAETHEQVSAELRPFFSFDGHQRVVVRGRLTCCKPPASKDDVDHCEPVKYTLVQLYDYDWFSPNDELNDTLSDEHGLFEISGNANEWWRLLPYLRVAHRCDVVLGHTRGTLKPEQLVRYSSYSIPPEYINKDVYELFPLNLYVRGWRDYQMGALNS